MTREGWVNALILAGLVAVPLWAHLAGEPFTITLATRAVIFAIAAAGLNIALGMGGLVSLGHAVFFGIGGYAMGILAHHAQTFTPLMEAPFLIEGTRSMPAIWLVAVAASALAALAIGLLSLRTSGVYFIMITLAFGQMFYYFAISWPAYGGEDGLSIYLRNGFPGVNTLVPLNFYLICLAILALVLGLTQVIARSAFGHLGGHICEVFKIGKVMNRENWRDHVTMDIPAESRKLLFERVDQPIIILTGHIGTWEAGVFIFSQKRPMIAIARKMNNPFVERFMKTHHFRGDITVIDKNKGFTPAVLRQWKRTAASLTIAMDQHAGRKTGVRVPFMGREAGTHTSPARLHLRSGVPVLIGAVIREAPFQYKLVGEDPIVFAPTGKLDDDVKTLLELFNRRLEKIIRAYPEQYLWAHNRWREEKKNGG